MTKISLSSIKIGSADIVIKLMNEAVANNAPEILLILFSDNYKPTFIQTVAIIIESAIYKAVRNQITMGFLMIFLVDLVVRVIKSLNSEVSLSDLLTLKT